MKDVLKSLKSFLPRIGSRWPARIIAVSFTTIGISVIGRLVWRVLFPNAPFTDQHSSACFLIALLSAFGLRLAYEIFHEEDDNPAPPRPTPNLSAEDVAAYDRLREDVLQHFRSAFDRLAEVEQLSNFIDRRIKSWVQRHWVMSLVSGFMIPIALVISLPLYIPKVVVNYISSRAAQNQVDELIKSKYGEVSEQIEILDLETKATANGSYDCLTRLIEMSRDKANPSRAEKAKLAVARVDSHYDNAIKFHERFVRDTSERCLRPGCFSPFLYAQAISWDLALASYVDSISKEDYDNTIESISLGGNDCLADFLCRRLELETNTLWRAQTLLSAINQIRERSGEKRLLLSERDRISDWRNAVVVYSSKYKVETELMGRWYEPFEKFCGIKDDDAFVDLVRENYDAFKKVVRSKPDSYFLAYLFYLSAISMKEEDVSLNGGVEKTRLVFADNRNLDSEFLMDVIDICQEGTESGYIDSGADYSFLSFRIALEQSLAVESTNTLATIIKERASRKRIDPQYTMKLIFAALNKYGKRLSDFPDLNLYSVFPTWESYINQYDLSDCDEHPEENHHD